MLKKLATPDCKCAISKTGDLNIVDINNQKSKARISEQGAQLLEWQPANHEPVIWLSPKAQFQKSKPIRGGIPICWPWFGSHPISCDYPSHGFARRKNWKLRQCQNAEDMTNVTFELINDDHDSWPYPCTALLKYSIGETLAIKLTTINLSHTAALSYTQALHTYFNIGDIEKIEITGLENAEYIDKLNRTREKSQKHPLKIDSGIDRIYCDISKPVELNDHTLNRRITISHEGASAIVVWNPGKEKADKMPDMGPENAHKNMVCVETATAGNTLATIPPSGNHTIATTYTVSHL